MNSILCPNLFLLADMGVLSRIAYREQANEFIPLGSIHDFLYLARLVAYGDMKRRSQAEAK